MSNRYSGPAAGPDVLELLSQPQPPADAPPAPPNPHLRSPDDTTDAFIIKPATEWLQTDTPYLTEPHLFGPFWSRGEVCILFADTNLGKSILAVQIADALSKGQPVQDFETSPRAEVVLYFDFELTAPQFTQRYSSAQHGHYQFAPGFARLVFNPYADGEYEFNSYTDYLHNAIEDVVQSTGARILIIDNITCLHSGTQSNITAINLMKKLQTIKRHYGLSILVLAHTPKRNPARPITHNCLQGSKMLINFADSAFAIGHSQTRPDVRYLKQIKQRSGRQQYGADNVCLCQVVKADNFLHLQFLGHGHEADHLLNHTEQGRKATEDRITQLHTAGQSLRAIAAQTGISYGTVFRHVRRLTRDENDSPLERG